MLALTQIVNITAEVGWGPEAYPLSRAYPNGQAQDRPRCVRWDPGFWWGHRGSKGLPEAQKTSAFLQELVSLQVFHIY